MSFIEKLYTFLVFATGTPIFITLGVVGYLKQDMGALLLGNICLMILIGGCTPTDVKATKTSYYYSRQSRTRDL